MYPLCVVLIDIGIMLGDSHFCSFAISLLSMHTKLTFYVKSVCNNTYTTTTTTTITILLYVCQECINMHLVL